MKLTRFLFLFIILSFIFSSLIFAETGHIGNVKKLKGNSFIIHNTKKLKATLGEKLFEGDRIITETNSALGIVFIDGTVMTIGEESELFLNKYVFQPVKEEYDFDVFLKKGSGIYNSGRLGKLSPQSVKVKTPEATIGIRGTKFLIKVK